MVGVNGSGKTTLLRALAGLTPVDAGRIRLGAEVVDDPAAGIFVPARRRRVGMVFEDHALFPHLSALDNVAFAARCSGMGRREAQRQPRTSWRGSAWRISATTAPGRLSRGQRQRVALARVLAARPRLLLLDEPLSALDPATRRSARDLLAAVMRTFPGPALLVTHDREDAAALAERTLVLDAPSRHGWA